MKNNLIILCIILISLTASQGQGGMHKRALRAEHPESFILPDPGIAQPAGDIVTAGISLDFESLADFTLDFTPWTTSDLDSAETYGFEGVSFPHAYDPMAFIVFDPSKTAPSLGEDPALQPHGGSKFAACFSSIPPKSNNDWLISPQIALGNNSSLSFWVKSYTADYGLEKYKVGVSTGGNSPGDFQIISGPDPLLAPATGWASKQFDIGVYDNQNVYIAIQCISTDAFVFMLDDIAVETETPGLIAPSNLNALLDEETGKVSLSWDFEGQGSSEWINVSGTWNQIQSGFDAGNNDTRYASVFFDFQMDEYELSAQVSKKTGTDPKGVGFFLNCNPQQLFSNGFWKSGYLFLVGNTGGWQYYSFGKQVDNEFILLADWTFNEVIQPGWETMNDLSVKVHDGSFEISINDSLLVTVYDTTYKTGYCGLALYDESAGGTAMFGEVVIDYDPPSKEFNNFRIYRNGGMIAETNAKFYTDQLPVSGSYDYWVTARYDEGESQASNTAQADWKLGIEETGFKTLKLYPNPSGGMVMVESEDIIHTCRVYDYTGRCVCLQMADSKTVTLDLSGYPGGVYLVVAESEGQAYLSKVILDKSK
ncbi:MAG: T9SS type A sorting domain-containing protein [Bacteroidales bacterium]|nr:T9SS type A sorting domain-containing protein [Bacteroidales bacterium]